MPILIRRSPWLALIVFTGVAWDSASAAGMDAQREAAVEVAREAGRATEGLRALQGLLQDHPDDPKLLADTVIVANWAGQDSVATSLFERSATPKDNLGVLEAAARSYRNLHHFHEAARLFQKAVELEPTRWQSQLGLALTQVESGRADLARPLMEQLATQHPREREVLMGLGYAYRTLGEPVRAVGFYADAAKLWPDDPEIPILEALALSEAGGSWRASEFPMPDILAELEVAANLGAEEIHWGEAFAPARTDQIKESSRSLSTIDKTLARLRRLPSGSRRDALIRQTTLDRILALRDLKRYQEVIADWEALPDPAAVPLYTKEAVAGALLSLRHPRKAEPLYREVVAGKPGQATAWIGLAYSLLESERIGDALETIDTANARSPVWLTAPGLRTPKPNPSKPELMLQAALMRRYADDLAGADKRMTSLVAEAPANISFRRGLAEVALARGHPQRALEALRIAGTFEPADEGLAMSLMETHEALGLRDRADTLLSELQTRNPDSDSLKNFLKARKITRDWQIEANFLQGWGNGSQVGSNDHFGEIWIHSPLIWNRWRAFVHTEEGYARFDDGPATRWRQGIGIRYDYARQSVWGEVSIDGGTPGTRAAFTGGLALTLSDSWTVSLEGSTDSRLVPLQAAQIGVYGPGGSLGLEWRQNECRSASLGAAFSRFSDDNLRFQISAAWTERLFTGPHVKINGSLVGYASHNSAGNQRDYFNPSLDGEIGPRLELDWLTHRRYDFKFHQYLSVFCGAYWQQDFGTSPAFAVRYGQRWRPRPGLDFTWGISWGRHAYDGGAEDRIALDVGLTWGAL